MNINYYKQPTGNTCGPSCIKMVHTSILGLQDSSQITIEDISKLCGTDWIVGTPPDRMEKGFIGLDINYLIHVNNEKPFDEIEKAITNESIVVLRTLTKGVPHWIIVNSYIDNLYNILDPWLGRIQYTKEELDDIWRIRDYFYFEIPK